MTSGQQITIVPRTYEDKTSLILPLWGKIFVWEGHDFFSHHLRVPLADPDLQRRGITADSNNFANDFIYVNEAGRAYHDDPRKLENWYGYGKPVYAPGAGVILASANDIPDNWFENAQATVIGHPKLSSKNQREGTTGICRDLTSRNATSLRLRAPPRFDRGAQAFTSMPPKTAAEATHSVGSLRPLR